MRLNSISININININISIDTRTSLSLSDSRACNSSAAANPAPGFVSSSPNIKKEGILRDLNSEMKK